MDCELVGPPFRMVVAHEGELSSIGRESDVRVQIVEQLLGRATQKRGAVEKLEFGIAGIAAAKIKVIAVGREAQGVVISIGWGFHLRVAVGGYVAQPEARQSVLA